MKPRTLTIASFFSVAMAATLVGALVTSQVRRPEPAVARPRRSTGSHDRFHSATTTATTAANPAPTGVSASSVPTSACS